MIKEGEKNRCYEILLENGEIILRNRYHLFRGSPHTTFRVKNRFCYDDDEDVSCNINRQPNNKKTVTFKLDDDVVRTRTRVIKKPKRYL